MGDSNPHPPSSPAAPAPAHFRRVALAEALATCLACLLMVAAGCLVISAVRPPPTPIAHAAPGS